MLAAANFSFVLNDGAIYGYFSTVGLQALDLYDGDAAPPPILDGAPHRASGRILHELLERYFSGAAVSFCEIPVDLESGTPFQQSVWRAIIEIPYGNWTTYGALARRIGKPRAARAVGMALGANPVSIVAPCHRVLAANGGLGGFSAGLHWKKRLLELEKIPFLE